MQTIIISDITARYIEEARAKRTEWVNLPDDDILFNVLTEWLAKQGEQSLNEWIREFF